MRSPAKGSSKLEHPGFTLRFRIALEVRFARHLLFLVKAWARDRIPESLGAAHSLLSVISE